MTKVVLIRGKKETLTYKHTSLIGAWKRAEALATLHSVVVDSSQLDVLTVDASDWYGR